jgi:hypothetical protein
MPDTCISCGEGFEEFPQSKQTMEEPEDFQAYVDHMKNGSPLRTKLIGYIHHYCVSTYENKLRSKA